MAPTGLGMSQKCTRGGMSHSVSHATVGTGRWVSSADLSWLGLYLNTIKGDRKVIWSKRFIPFVYVVIVILKVFEFLCHLNSLSRHFRVCTVDIIGRRSHHFQLWLSISYSKHRLCVALFLAQWFWIGSRLHPSSLCGEYLKIFPMHSLRIVSHDNVLSARMKRLWNYMHTKCWLSSWCASWWTYNNHWHLYICTWLSRLY